MFSVASEGCHALTHSPRDLPTPVKLNIQSWSKNQNLLFLEGPFHVVVRFLPSKSVFFSHRTVLPWEAQVQSSLFLDVSQVGNFQVSIHLPIGMMQILFLLVRNPCAKCWFEPMFNGKNLMGAQVSVKPC